MAAVNSAGNSLTGLSGSGSFVGATAPTITTPNIAQINTSGNPAMSFVGGSTYLQMVAGAGSGAYYLMQAFDPVGGDVPIYINAGSAGEIRLGTQATTNQFVLATGGAKLTTISVDNATSTARTLTIPDASGTATLLGNTATGSGSPAVKAVLHFENTYGRRPLKKLKPNEATLLALRALDTAAESDSATGGVDRRAKIFPIVKLITERGIETLSDARLARLYRGNLASA